MRRVLPPLVVGPGSGERGGLVEASEKNESAQQAEDCCASTSRARSSIVEVASVDTASAIWVWALVDEASGGTTSALREPRFAPDLRTPDIVTMPRRDDA